MRLGDASPEREDDRTTRARIRDAAVTLFAEDGIPATTVRAIATAAGVSPGLVIHHFGSKEGLRTACDHHVVALIREQKTTAMRAGPGYDPLTTLREARGGLPLARYLARTLVDGSPQVAAMVDELVDDAAKYMDDGVRSGMLRPSAYPYQRAAVLTIWSLGALVLHDHLQRLIGADLLGEIPTDPATAAAYTGPVLELLSQGLLAPEVAARLKDVLVDGSTQQEESEARDG